MTVGSIKRWLRDLPVANPDAAASPPVAAKPVESRPLDPGLRRILDEALERVEYTARGWVNREPLWGIAKVHQMAAQRHTMAPSQRRGKQRSAICRLSGIPYGVVSVNRPPGTLSRSWTFRACPTRSRIFQPLWPLPVFRPKGAPQGFSHSVLGSGKKRAP